MRHGRPFQHLLEGILVVVLGTGSTVAAAAQTIDEFGLANGLRVAVQLEPGAAAVTVSLQYRVGFVSDGVGRSGLTHLIQHIMLRGTDDGGSLDFDRRLSRLGARTEGFSTSAETVFTTTAPAGALAQVLEVEVDRMLSFPEVMHEEALAREIAALRLEEAERSASRPYGAVESALREVMFPEGNPHRLSPEGSSVELQTLSPRQVADFQRSYFRPTNLRLEVRGDTDPAAVRLLVESLFAHISRGVAAPEPPAWGPPLEREVRLVLEDDVEVPRLYMVWKVPAPNETDRLSLEAVVDILGGAGGSRLSGLPATVAVVGWGTGTTFRVVLSANRLSPLSPLEKATWAELQRLVDDGPSEAEVERAYQTLGLRRLSDRRGQTIPFLTITRVMTTLREILATPPVILSVIPNARPDLASTGAP